MESVTTLLGDLAALGDPVRSRILLLLERTELTVSDLCRVLLLPQSTVSRHLKTLADSGWVRSRRDGTSRYYALDRARLGRRADGAPSGRSGRNAASERAAATGRESVAGRNGASRPAAADGAGRRLWALVREHVAATPGALQDARRLSTLLARRRARSERFFSSAAKSWDRLREELFGATFHLDALLGLLDAGWTVGDLGCGTGQVAAALAPVVARVVGVDASAEMLQAARRRLRGFANVELRRGPLEALPIDDAALDAAAVVLVLHHLPDPGAALAEAARVLRPGGRLLLVDMLPHEREDFRRRMGHVWLGFSEDLVGAELERAGFDEVRLRPLAPAPGATGPALFAAVARRPAVATAGSAV
jgi:ArsR family transcriptional regulator